MAELIMPEEEKETVNYLDWDDASLGKAVKKLAKDIADRKGQDSIAQTACATLLISMASERGAIGTRLTLDGVSENGKDIGDWEVTIQRKKRV